MSGYRGGIFADLAHERGHMCLFSRLPGGRPAATSGANHAGQRWFSPVDAELRQTLIRVPGARGAGANGQGAGLMASATPYVTVEVQAGGAIFSNAQTFRRRGRGLGYP
jgi:hypothetical protein